MNMGRYHNDDYAPQGRSRVGKRGQQEQWDQYQRLEQAPRQALNETANRPVSTSTPASRERADSWQSQQSQISQEQSRRQSPGRESHGQSHFDDDGQESRMRSSSSGDCHTSWPSTSRPQGELRRLSAGFNSPTHVELERQKDHRKGLRGITQLKVAVKGWVRTRLASMQSVSSIWALCAQQTETPSDVCQRPHDLAIAPKPHFPHSLHHCESPSTMDHYPEVNVEERSVASSRHDSASSVNKNRTEQSNSTSSQQETQYTSFPPPSNTSTSQSHRTNSANSTTSSSTKETQRIEAQYARYTDAPPQYTEQQYEGKSEDQINSMRMSDYAKEISRIMGRQIVKDMKIAQHKTKSKSVDESK
ncbi:hypothetical protein T440DRAFT_446739 [Plenodomus tracheiphilus IPT5]|uniref:Uncharacterized protein n=1 Tax=Plenodomus tracheiphilus IPT5 TaxID=1408161 RepID=A0A6A7BCM1_9PLEO|nr:hypothetical protein T440DRAFT_446739 [Plenodomus tracheiphilus IPT5]